MTGEKPPPAPSSKPAAAKTQLPIFAGPLPLDLLSFRGKPIHGSGHFSPWERAGMRLGMEPGKRMMVELAPFIPCAVPALEESAAARLKRAAFFLCCSKMKMLVRQPSTSRRRSANRFLLRNMKNGIYKSLAINGPQPPKISFLIRHAALLCLP